MELQDAVSLLSDMARKSEASQFDILGGLSRSLGISVYQGKVRNTEISESVGIGIRVLRNGHPGYAFTERFTADALKQTLSDAMSHSAFTEPLAIDLPAPEPLPAALPTWHSSLANVDATEMVRACLSVETQAMAKDSAIVNIPYLGADLHDSQSLFVNHKGVQHSFRANSWSLGTGVVAERDGTRKMGVYNQGGRDWTKLDTTHIAHTAVSRGVELLGAAPIQGGNHPVVFSERVAGNLLSMFLSAFYADNVHKGQSRLKGKVGTSIASPLFTLTCDPTRTDLPGSELLDGEGVVPMRFDVVSAGVLQDFLYNLESAARDNRRSTGNASRGYSGKVGTAFSNCVVAPGNQDTAALTGLFPNCLLIVKLEGGSGCSAISGEISIGAQGFWCENGVIVHPVEGITLSANIFDLLPQLVGVGSMYNDSFSSVKVPALAFESMAVSC